MPKSPSKKKRVPQYYNEASSIAHIKIHTKEDPIPTNVRQLEMKGFIAVRSKVFVKIKEN